MSNTKKIFFEQGYVTRQSILSCDEADEINNDYTNFLNKKNSWVNLTDHKSKTHLFFP